MDYRGSATYISRYSHDHHRAGDGDDEPDNDDVGDLDFAAVFTPGHDGDADAYWARDRERVIAAARHGRPRPRNHHDDRDYWMRHGGRARRGDRHESDEEEEEDPLIFDFDFDDDDDDDEAGRRHNVPGWNQRRPRADAEHVRDLQERVSRQERYVENVRDQVRSHGAEGDGEGGGEALRRAEDALATLREALREVEGGGGGGVGGGWRPPPRLRGYPPPHAAAAVAAPPVAEQNNRGNGGGVRGRDRHRNADRQRGRPRPNRPRGLSPHARHQLQQDLEQQLETRQQLAWMGADARELADTDAEIQYLRDVLAGRLFAAALGGQGGSSSSSSSPSSPSSSRSEGSGGDAWTRRVVREQQRKRRTGCYHGPVALSEDDARLPPPGIALTEPVELYDAEGPRFLALITLRNPAEEARKEEEQMMSKAREMFGRYEAQFFTVMERAMECGALKELSSGPRGVIWVIEAGREDVLGAMLRAREEPFRILSWELLAVGRGSSEGVVFCLHKVDGDDDDGGHGSGSG